MRAATTLRVLYGMVAMATRETKQWDGQSSGMRCARETAKRGLHWAMTRDHVITSEDSTGRVATAYRTFSEIRAPDGLGPHPWTVPLVFRFANWAVLITALAGLIPRHPLAPCLLNYPSFHPPSFHSATTPQRTLSARPRKAPHTHP
jgi:hypothetical protein